MTTLLIDDVLPRTQITATGGQTVFDTNWTVDDVNDVVVYARPSGNEDNDKELLVSDSNYNVTLIGGSEQVRVTFLSGRTAGDIITITRATPGDRDNFYTNTNFTPEMLNADFARRIFLEQENELARTEYIPRYNTSAVIQQPEGSPNYYGQDIILPILPANSVWVKNADNNEITTASITDITLFGDVDFYTVTDQTSILPNSVPLAPFATGFLSNVNGSGITYSRTMTGTANEVVVTNGDGSGGNPTFGIADNPVIPGNEKITIPDGTTAQRPGSPQAGDFRYNSDDDVLEYWDADTMTWKQLVSTGGFIPPAPPTTDNAIVRWDGVNGDAIQNSNITIDDSGNLTANNSGAIFLWGTNTVPTNSKFHVLNPAAQGIMTLSENINDATTKNAFYSVPHFTNAEEAFGAYGATSNSTQNRVKLGGGNSFANAATEIDFFTAANNTTTTGTLRGTIDGTGNFLLGTQTLPTQAGVILNKTYLHVSNTMSDTTTKTGIIGAPHYDNSEELAHGILVSSQNTNNFVRIGGGNANANAATLTSIYAAANNTTTTGTEIIRYTTDGWSMNSGTDFFDRYEEEKGHTQTVSFATPGTSSFSYTTRAFEYQIIGNRIEFYFNIIFIPTIGTGSGNVQFSLPLTSAQNGGGTILGSNVNISWNSRTMLVLRVLSGANNCIVQSDGSSQAPHILQASDLTNGVSNQIRGVGTYFI